VRTRMASLPFQVGIGIGEVTIGGEHCWAVSDRTQRVKVQELKLNKAIVVPSRTP
jgi:hypothetical protein